MQLFTYLLKVSGCMAAFYLVYYLSFRKLTFFTLNRWYLLLTLLISLIIPMLHIGVEMLLPAPDVTPVIINTAAKTIRETDMEPQIKVVEAGVNWWQFAGYAYWAITGLLLLRFVVTFCRILFTGVINGEKKDGYYLVNGSVYNNSSFFGYIFLKGDSLNEDEKEQVIAHEMVHVEQLHSIDNMFAGLLKAVLWFNPFIYLFEKALCQSHEFEVDHCLAARYNSKNYAGLLLKLSSPGTVALVNRFSAYGLKSRINMLFASPTATIKMLSYLLTLPVTAALVYFLAVEKVYAYQHAIPKFTLVLDAGHGGSASGAQAGGLVEKDLALQIVKEIKAVANACGINTVLTRDDDRFVSIPDRLKLQGDVFVSIHINSVSGAVSNLSGIKLMINKKNKDFDRSQKLAASFISELKNLSGLSMDENIYSDQNIRVISDNNAPAVLLEIGYLTNKNDVQYITNKQNQHNVAVKFVNALMDYQKADPAKVSGATAKRGSGDYSVGVSPAAIKNSKGAVQQAVLHADTVEWKTMQARSAKKAKRRMDHDTVSLKISYASNGSDAAGGNLYEEFSRVKLLATDSTKYDARDKMVYYYNSRLTAGKLNIKADIIKMSLKDSVVFADGHVNLKFTDPAKLKKDETAITMDHLTIDLKIHPMKN